MAEELTHIDAAGKAAMVDISGKEPVKRTAVAAGKIHMQQATLDLLKKGLLKKGDALACARIAGIMGGKKTAELIPLCHTIPIDRIAVDFTVEGDGIAITATALCTGKTGVEMEALCAVSIAALTLYDMCKAVDTQMRIQGIHLVEKKKEPLT